jgi:ethylmalonyl-CoA mutase
MPQAAERDRPWLFRTYAGHSSAAASNALFKANLARGQTGLSVAFDLPTQTGYDSDHPLAAGEVGRVGVPVCSLADLLTLFDGIPLATTNTSMTINATAPWLLALYIVAAEGQGAARTTLAGTVQNDLLKEYLSRGTYVFPPKPSLKLTCDVIAFAAAEMPKWNPINVCSYHLQEAGAGPVQELAFTLANAIAVLDALRDGGEVAPDALADVVGRISFFVNAGPRFVTEMCKMRAFVELWDEIARTRYGVMDPKLCRFRYGVQVNSLGLTEQQPENNVYRILLSTLAVVLSKSARARAVQLPAWNEALGLPRPWDQQWSLRLQQILACETDLLEFEDLFDGSPVVAERVGALKAEARAELARIEAMGGALTAVDVGYMKQRLVESGAKRLADVASAAQKVVGVNCFCDTERPALAAEGGFLAIDPAAEAEQVERLRAHRDARDPREASSTLEVLRAAAAEGRNIMEPSIACARAGVTTGEWAQVLRAIFGDYRASTGVAGVRAAWDTDGFAPLRQQVDRLAARLGRRPKMLVGKPGLDGHSNGAEQIAVCARDCGFEVVYEGIRLTPARIANAALEEGVHVVGLSILSGAHGTLVAEVLRRLRDLGLGDVPVVVGGIIPADDARTLRQQGVARVFTPKDYALAEVMAEIVRLIEQTAVAAEELPLMPA